MPSRRIFLATSLAASLLPLAANADQSAELRLLWDVAGGASTEADAALATMRSSNRRDLVAGLILALRFVPERSDPINATLFALTGEAEAKDWFDWMLWQEKHPEFVPHPAFVEFMRDLYLRIDPEFDRFLRPEYLTRAAAKIRAEEITWGGVVKDGIPALDNPDLISATKATYLRDDDLVFGVSINGDARAYPLRIMGWHEMFNDAGRRARRTREDARGILRKARTPCDNRLRHARRCGGKFATAAFAEPLPAVEDHRRRSHPLRHPRE